MQLLNPDLVRIEPRTLGENIATFSLDVETDYATGRDEALSQIERFIDLMAELRVPWTAFVEGRFFETRRPLCRLLLDRGVDVQLHCYDHAEPGDTPAALERSAEVYADFCGRKPEGYRAHTYRLTQPVFETLRRLGFRWDSSLMRAYAQGGNRHPKLLQGDYLILDGQLHEFPIATWKGLPVALNHTHMLLAKSPGELVLRSLFGPTRLVTYNFHMTDLVRCSSLFAAKRTPTVRLLHRYLWSTHSGDTFGVVRRFVRFLRARQYDFVSTSGLFERVRSADDFRTSLETRSAADDTLSISTGSDQSDRSRPGFPP
jgi:hypothetical protein